MLIIKKKFEDISRFFNFLSYVTTENIQALDMQQYHFKKIMCNVNFEI